MTNTYFDSAGGLVAFGSYEEGDFIIKNALLLVAGPQKDNKGRLHEFPAHRVQLIADNTNAAFDSGVEIPLMIDHAKTLINSTGGINKLGFLDSRVEGRIIRERDLPNPRMRNLIGKFGMFGKYRINHYVDEVRKGLFKSLSPGIDLDTERLAEASAVAFPAIHGPALFRASDDTRIYFSTNYAEAKEQLGAIRKLKGEAQDCFDILFRVLSDISNADSNDMIGATPESLKLKAADDFYQDLLNLLGLNEERTEEVVQPAVLSPYGDMPQQYQQQYSEEGSRKTEEGRRVEFEDESEDPELEPDLPPSSFLLPPSLSLKKRRRN